MMLPYIIGDTFSWQWISSYTFIGLYNQAIRIPSITLHDITHESQWHRWYCKYADHRVGSHRVGRLYM